MPDQRPIRACAIQEYAFEEPRLISLWETDPHFQTKMIEAVNQSNALDREIEPDPAMLEDRGGPLHAVVWQTFSIASAVATANDALHEEKFFEELEEQLDGNDGAPIPTVQQRIQADRVWIQKWSSIIQ
jgi:hypothetical protein